MGIWDGTLLMGTVCTIRCPDSLTSISSDSCELRRMQMYVDTKMERISSKETTIIEKKYKQCVILKSSIISNLLSSDKYSDAFFRNKQFAR